MDTAQVKRLFGGIHVWTRGDERAPHKPLLLLYALGRCSRNERRLIPYADVDRDLRTLLLHFGPQRKSQHPEYPFWRLQNDGVWELHGADLVKPRASNNDARKSDLLKHHVQGGFPASIFAALRAKPRLLAAVAQGLLDANFPASMHEDILSAVGFDLPAGTVVRSSRDPAFCSRLLTAYEYRCAICGFDVRLGSVSLGIEAAHIKWHPAGGPDVEANGLACAPCTTSSSTGAPSPCPPRAASSCQSSCTAVPGSASCCCLTTGGPSGHRRTPTIGRLSSSWLGTARKCSGGRRGTSGLTWSEARSSRGPPRATPAVALRGCATAATTPSRFKPLASSSSIT